jgi:branched-chain amino acid transport system substrate-binding protein
LANYVCGETAWTYALKTGRNPELVERFKKLKGKLPTGCAFGCGYAATEIVLDAIKRAGTLDKEAIRDAIAATDLITVCGRARFDIKELPGRAAMDPIFIQWQPIKEKPFTTQQVFWPEEIATAKLVYPAPPWKERKL